MTRKITYKAGLKIAFLGIIMLGIAQVTVGQTSHNIAVTSNVFTPEEITIEVGDTVIWTNTQGNHNVNADQSIFASNPESFGNAVGADWTFKHVFTMAGTYDYQCDPHVGFGMVGQVLVDIQSSTNIREQGTNGISIYPNPSAGQIAIQSDSEMESIDVYSLSGSVVKSYTGIGTSFYELSLEDIAAGVYFFKIRTAIDDHKMVRVVKY